jgi:hypothetical protein
MPELGQRAAGGRAALARISYRGIELRPYVEDVRGAGLERNAWWFHGLSEAQAVRAADRPEAISHGIK